MRNALSLHVITLLAASIGLAGCGGEGPTTTCSGKSGDICTFIGSGDLGFNGDGRDRLASALGWPTDVEFAPDGRAFIVDWNNHRIRRINADGKLETVIGNFVGDGPPDFSDLADPGAPGTTVDLNHPTDLQFLPDGRMLMASWHNHKIRRLDPATGLVRVTCGDKPGFAGDGMPAVMAKLNMPKALALAADGGLFLTDNRNQRIRRIGTDDAISTVAGVGPCMMPPCALGDDGPALMASFNLQTGIENPEPSGGLAVDPSGKKLYVADTRNQRIRLVDLAADRVTTVAGTGEAGYAGDGGPATAAKLHFPTDVELGPDGRLYVADTDNHRIRVVDLATGIITTFAGTGVKGFSGDNGPAATAQLARPFGVAFDAAGNLYVTDTFNNRIRRIAK